MTDKIATEAFNKIWPKIEKRIKNGNIYKYSFLLFVVGREFDSFCYYKEEERNFWDKLKNLMLNELVASKLTTKLEGIPSRLIEANANMSIDNMDQPGKRRLEETHSVSAKKQCKRKEKDEPTDEPEKQ
jgi:hypothetical protein